MNERRFVYNIDYTIVCEHCGKKLEEKAQYGSNYAMKSEDIVESLLCTDNMSDEEFTTCTECGNFMFPDDKTIVITEERK